MTPNGTTATAPAAEMTMTVVSTVPEEPQLPLPGDSREVRRLPKRVETFTLPEPYEDFHITAWVNFPGRLREDMRSGDVEKINAALTQIVLAHDLVDFDGKPYPPASDAAFWTEAPDDVGFAIMGALRERFGKLPKASGARS